MFHPCFRSVSPLFQFVRAVDGRARLVDSGGPDNEEAPVQEPHPQIEISRATYGKEAVRILTWTRIGPIDTVRDACLGVHVEGAFLASYRSGDNAAILPSDTLRRHALAACDENPTGTVEALLAGIATRILEANSALSGVAATAQTRQWQRIGDHSFVLAPWRASAEARSTRAGPVRLRGGASGLQLLTTTGSGFTGFMRDEVTTQAEASDRPLCGTLDADWAYVADRQPAAGLTDKIVGRLVSAFADRTSNAVQQLLTEIGGEVLEATAELASITLHFDSVPAVPIPSVLSALDAGNAHEIGVGPVGVTDVVLRRA
jgi:urate oxidase